MAARYRVTAILNGRVKTGRSHLLRTVPRALERMGLRAEAQERRLGKPQPPHVTEQEGPPYLSCVLGTSSELTSTWTEGVRQTLSLLAIFQYNF